MTDVSTTTITVNWTSPISEDVTYYNISFSPSCPELSPVNMILNNVTHQSSTTFSYTLRQMSSGMNYTIIVRAGNILGVSSGKLEFSETDATSELQIFCDLYIILIP